MFFGLLIVWLLIAGEGLGLPSGPRVRQGDVKIDISDKQILLVMNPSPNENSTSRVSWDDLSLKADETLQIVNNCSQKVACTLILDTASDNSSSIGTWLRGRLRFSSAPGIRKGVLIFSDSRGIALTETIMFEHVDHVILTSFILGGVFPKGVISMKSHFDPKSDLPSLDVWAPNVMVMNPHSSFSLFGPEIVWVGGLFSCPHHLRLLLDSRASQFLFFPPQNEISPPHFLAPGGDARVSNFVQMAGSLISTVEGSLIVRGDEVSVDTMRLEGLSHVDFSATRFFRGEDISLKSFATSDPLASAPDSYFRVNLTQGNLTLLSSRIQVSRGEESGGLIEVLSSALDSHLHLIKMSLVVDGPSSQSDGGVIRITNPQGLTQFEGTSLLATSGNAGGSGGQIDLQSAFLSNLDHTVMSTCGFARNGTILVNQHPLPPCPPPV